MLDLDRRLADFMASHQIPGVSIAVWHRGTLHRAAAGVLNVNTGVEVTTDAIFQVGSITKLFTAALVMQLVDDGLVDLDAPVRTYLPGFALADEAAAAERLGALQDELTTLAARLSDAGGESTT